MIILKEFELKDFFSYFCSFNKIALIALCTILGIVIGQNVKSKATNTYYNTSSTIILGTLDKQSEINYDGGMEDQETLYNRYYYINNSLSLNKNLAPTYENLIYSNKILNQITSNLELDITNEELKKCLSIEIAEDTAIVKISASYKDADITKKMVDIATEVFINEIQSLYGISNIKIIDTADLPTQQHTSESNSTMIVFTAIGFIIPILYFLIKFYFDDTLTSDYQIEKTYELPIIGYMQSNKNIKIKFKNLKQYCKYLNSKTKNIKNWVGLGNELVFYDENSLHLREEIKLIETNLKYNEDNEEATTILITSSVPGEGKSYLAANLLTSICKSGKKALLIDSDFKNGRINEIFNISTRKKGFSDLLVDYDDDINIEDYINTNKISIITKGNSDIDFTNLLNSDNFKKVLDVLKKQFDVIIFDSCSVIGFADAVTIAKEVDNVILVATNRYTPLNLFSEAKELLSKVGAQINGVVINRKNNTKKYLRYLK